MSSTAFVHESSYKGADVIAYSHRARLKSIARVLRKVGADRRRQWADFGCSNGFIIEQMTAAGFRFESIVGFDHELTLLELARAKNIPGADFDPIDLNSLRSDPRRFDLVTCFETLEHVGDYRTAFRNVQQHLAERGLLVIGVPNEVGVPGLIKFVGRALLQRDPYVGFFESTRDKWRYFWRLLSYGAIEDFRRRNEPGYGPHLGFDHRCLLRHVEQNYVRGQRLQFVSRHRSFLNMTVFYVFQA